MPQFPLRPRTDWKLYTRIYFLENYKKTTPERRLWCPAVIIHNRLQSENIMVKFIKYLFFSHTILFSKKQKHCRSNLLSTTKNYIFENVPINVFYSKSDGSEQKYFLSNLIQGLSYTSASSSRSFCLSTSSQIDLNIILFTTH